MSTTTTVATATATPVTTTAAAAAPAPDPLAAQHVTDAMRQALNRVPVGSGGGGEGENPQHPVGGGGGPPVGGGGNPGGPGGPGGGAPAAQPVPQAPIQPAADVQVMGTPPQVFASDCAEAKIFLDEFQRYIRVNRRVPGFESPIRLVALALTYIQGPMVANWAREMGQWLDTLDPILDNIPDVLRQFYEEFRMQYADSQQQQRVRQKLDTLKMSGDIDAYNAEFEDQC